MKTRLIRLRTGRLLFVSTIGNVSAYAPARSDAMRAVCRAYSFRVGAA